MTVESHHRYSIIQSPETERVPAKLAEIAEVLRRTLPQTTDIGLLTGRTGIAVFFFHYARFTGDDAWADLALDIISDVFDHINNQQVQHTFCSGLAGVGWTLEQLARDGFIDPEITASFDSIDDFLSHTMLRDIRKNLFDFLHGAVGYGVYYLKRLSNPRVTDYLIQLVDELEHQSQREPDGSVKWESQIRLEPRTMGYNLSASHGMSAVAYFLSGLLREGIYESRVRPMLEGTVQFILKHRLDTNVCRSVFPTWVAEGDPSDYSRLAWCYGDLGQGILLWQAAQAAGDSQWETTARDILLHSTHRTGPHDTGVSDAGLCHGAAGNMHIYHRMYRYTGVEAFKDSARYWCTQALDMAVHTDGYAGYKAQHNEENGGWITAPGILEGVAGIGLAFIALIAPEEPTWDGCLLLS